MSKNLFELQTTIDNCMVRDRSIFSRDVRRIQIRLEQDKPVDRAIKSLQQRIEKSILTTLNRKNRIPPIQFPAELPVVEKKAELIEAIKRNQVVVVCGETGSGKTTQLPKICLQSGRGVYGMIGHTQPRRVAARTVATRIAQELMSELGQIVGYKVRFDDKSSVNSHIKIMTDGILLAETVQDRYLSRYDTLILDEAHERSLNIDFLIGYIKRILPQRPDLKLIITSATIDPEKFSRHFNNAPIVEVSGRTYPVEVIYQDIDNEKQDLMEDISNAVAELMNHGAGDVLIFLSGEREIRDCANFLNKRFLKKADILPLYSRLSIQEQNKVFSDHTRRRLVLATNVAETSLTVPGIRYVIDSGYARISRYSAHSKVQRLPIEKISQASANQRKGRCGRLSAGICIRLYTKEDFENRPEYTQPELLRTNLASVILSMKVLSLGAVDQFPFLEPPDRRMINDGYKLLDELGALDRNGRVTKVGHLIAHLPVDPRIAKMIVAAQELNCLHEVLIIAGALSIQDPRERPRDKMQSADERHKEFQDDQSDFVTIVNIWNRYNEQRKHLSKNKLKKWCQSYFLSYMKMYEWRELHSQLITLLKEKGIKISNTESHYLEIHQAILSGLLSQVGSICENGLYEGTRQNKFRIFPASGLFKKNPKWIMAAQLVDTGKLYAHYTARIDPNWIEPLGKHLLKLEHSDPHWNKKSQRVVAYENAKLYGLLIYSRRKVDFSNIEPNIARQIFIRDGLVKGNYITRAAFSSFNQSVLTEIEDLEHRSRRHDILIDEDMMFEFYDNRIPVEVVNPSQFEQWLSNQFDKRCLYFEKESLMRHPAHHITFDHYPEMIELNSVWFKIDYFFEPGNPDDGVNLNLPIALLNRTQGHHFDWLVPGLLRDKVIALIKSLPKALRKNFVPATNFADACLANMSPEEGTLKDTLGKHLTRMTGVPIPNTAWNEEQLPAHLKMNFRLLNMENKVIETSRDLNRLIDRHQNQVVNTVLANLKWSIEREELKEWDFGCLPQEVEQEQNGILIRGYPALVDHDTHVSVKVMGNKSQADEVTKYGLRRLYILNLGPDIKYLRKNLPNFDTIAMLYTPIGNAEELKNELIIKIIDQTFMQTVVTTQEEFQLQLKSKTPSLIKNANMFCDSILLILQEYRFLKKALNHSIPVSSIAAVADIKDQLSFLIYKGFIADTPYKWIVHLSRYLKAAKVRYEKLKYSPDKDKKNRDQLSEFWLEYKNLVEDPCHQSRLNENLQHYKWMIEEFRVSLFAQELKTALPVSLDRLQAQRKMIKSNEKKEG